MKRELGFAPCGLACCLCGENETCPGCRSDGCPNREACKNRLCCAEKALDGCWACPGFPCAGGMLGKPRIRAFAAYLKAHGAEKLLDRLARNEREGLLYHYPGQIIGDYDLFDTQTEIWSAIENGLCYTGMLVKESLSDDHILDLITVERTERWRQDGDPRYWTAVWFQSRDPRFPEKLSQALGGAWYAVMKAGHTKLVAFPGKVLRYRAGDAGGRRGALDYGRSIGIPQLRMDWED